MFIIILCIQESLLKFGKKALSHKDDELKLKEIAKNLGQVSLMLGVFAVAAFAVKQIFTWSNVATRNLKCWPFYWQCLVSYI